MYGFSPLLYFFFQAEDGIRDDLVTGVQTCALPIYPPRSDKWHVTAGVGCARVKLLPAPSGEPGSSGGKRGEFEAPDHPGRGHRMGFPAGRPHATDAEFRH